MKKATFYLFMIFLVITFTACEDQILSSSDDVPGLKRGGKQPQDVEQGDLYGDLIEVQLDSRGVPVLYPLKYRADYQDKVIEGIIDVINPRLTGPFDLTIYVRDSEGYVIMDPPDSGEELVPRTTTITIIPGPGGFIVSDDNISPVVLYDMEGEILEAVTLHVYPIEQGRLNLIRSSPDVLDRRIQEVIKNFGSGTVAAVIRDYCGRLFMLRTQDALDLGLQDKPIDSPLENMSIYYELMLYGFNRSAVENGLAFLVGPDAGQPGFNFKSRVDTHWDYGPYSYPGLSDITKQKFVMNLAASCIAAASDKSDYLILDEILLVNRFLGIPKAIGNDINTPATSVISFFPYVEQEVRLMNKTDKSQYSKYRYYIDYTFFSYTRQKFIETLVDYYTIVGDYDEFGNLIGSHKEVLVANLSLHNILLGNAPLTPDAIDIYRYTDKADDSSVAASAFANQADDYVQALEVIHSNEEFLVWKLPTPTWSLDVVPSPFSRTFSPFIYVPGETEGGGGSEGNGGNGNGGRR